MDAAIIELDSLADAVWAAAEDHDLVAPARIGLAFRRVDPVALVAGIHIRGQRRELGGAGVDALVDRAHAEPARAARSAPRSAGEAGEPRIRKPHLLQPQQRSRIVGSPSRRTSLLGDDLADALQKPRIVAAGGVDLGGREAVPEGLRDDQQPVGGRAGQRRLDRRLRSAGRRRRPASRLRRSR